MELNNEENKTSQNINVEQTNANVDQQNNSSPKEEKNKKGNKNILDIIIIVLCIITIVMLLMYLRKPDASIEKLVETPTIISQYRSNNFSRKPVSTTEACDENDRYCSNNIDYTYKCFFNGEELSYEEFEENDISGIKLKYIQISGLKDTAVQDKINKQIEETSKKLVEKAQKVGKNPIVNVDAYIMFNYANILSIDYYASAGTYEPTSYYSSKVHEIQYEEDMYYFYSDFTDVFRLDTGDTLSFEEIIAKDVQPKVVLATCIYPKLCQEYYNSSGIYEEDMSQVDYSSIENRMTSLLNKYDKYGIADFYLSERSISVRFNDGKYDRYDFEFRDYNYRDYRYYFSFNEMDTNNLCIYNIVKPKESLYKNGDKQKISKVYNKDLSGTLLYNQFVNNDHYLMINIEYGFIPFEHTTEEVNNYIETTKNYINEMYKVDKENLGEGEWIIYFANGYADASNIDPADVEVTCIQVTTPNGNTKDDILNKVIDKLTTSGDESMIGFYIYDYGISEEDFINKYNYLVKVFNRSLRLTNPDNYSPYYDEGDTYLTIISEYTVEETVENLYHYDEN